MFLIFILSCLFDIHGREPYSGDFVKNFYIGSYSDIYKSMPFKLRMIIGTTKLYILLSV